MDFRGYVQQTAPEFLDYVGNDVNGQGTNGINMDKLNSVGAIESPWSSQSLTAQGAVNQINRLYGNYAAANAGGGGDTNNTGGTYDPAAAAEAAKRAAALQGVMEAKSGYLGSANSSIDQYGTRYGNSITDYLDSVRTGQQNLDTMGAKNELAKKQGVSGVLGMVGRGIKSTGTMLANKNAGDSSAAGALANAYGQLGQRQMASVGNQYELGNMDIANQQTAFDTKRGKDRRDLELGKQEFVTNLLNDVQDKMSQLNAQLIDASLPDRIAIEQEKEAIRQRANSSLQQFDQNLASGASAIAPSSIDARRTAALDMMNKGTDLGAGAFNFTSQAPMQFQGSAPAGGGLPIFTLPRRRMG